MLANKYLSGKYISKTGTCDYGLIALGTKLTGIKKPRLCYITGAFW